MDEFEIDSQLLYNQGKVLDSQDKEDIENVVSMIMDLIKPHDSKTNFQAGVTLGNGNYRTLRKICVYSNMF